MFERRIPEWLRHAPNPSVRGFAFLAGFEAIARGILVSVFPVALYESLKNASFVSSVYFAVGIISLFVGLFVPFLNKFVPRRILYLVGAFAYILGSSLAIYGSEYFLILGLLFNTLATVITFVCFNAYVLDYISRIDLGKCETLRMFYSALGWTIGPVLGIYLWKFWEPLPFFISMVAAFGLLAGFLYM